MRMEDRKLPEGWKWVKLGDVATVANGYGFANYLQGRKDLQYPFIKVSDMNADGAKTFVSSAANTVDSAILAELRAKTYPAGTVIFPKVGGALLTNKKRVLAVEATFDNNIMGLVPLKVESQWLFAWIQTVDLRTLANTQALPSVRQSKIASLRIPLPPLPEQKRIAAILTEQMAAVEKARAAAEAQFEAAKALPAAYLKKAFPQQGQELPEGWKWVKLGDVCYQDRQIIEPSSDESIKRTYLSLEHIEAQTGKILREPSGQVEDEGKSTTFAFDSGHVLYGKLRPYLNKVSLPDFIGRCTTELIPLRPLANISRSFLALLLRRNETVAAAMRQKTGARMPRADMDNLLKLTVPLPPLSEQKRIAGILNEQMSEAERLRNAIEDQLKEINAMPAALLRKAFNGEL